MMKRVVSLVAMLLAMTGAVRGDSITGYSSPFRVDTRCKKFVIADVRSMYCQGAYGMKGGKRATFLAGVPAAISFEVTMVDSEIPIERVTVNGEEFAGVSFTYDVGTLPTGKYGPMSVVAHGTVEGLDVVSEPFTVNLDVARLPTGTDWYWEATSKTYKRPDKEPLALLPKIEASVDVGNKALGFANVGKQLKLPVWFDYVPTLAFTETFDIKNGEYTRTAGGGFGKIGSFAGGVVRVEGGGAFRKSWNEHSAAWEKTQGGGWAKVKMDEVGRVWYPFSPLIGLYVSLRFSADESIEIGWNHAKEEFYWDAPLDPLIEAKMAAGIGWEKVHNVGVWGSGGLYAHLSSEYPVEMGIDLKAGYAYTDIENLAEGEQRLETYRKRIELLPVEKVEKDEYWTNPDPTIWKRFRAQMCLDPSMTPGLVCTPNGSAQVCLGQLVGGSVSLRGSGGGKPAGTSGTPILAVAVSEGEGTGLETPWNDGTPDSSPCIGADEEGRLFAVWMNARTAYAEGMATDAILGAQEIAVAVRDSGTGIWAARNLTDNGVMDTSPVLAVGANGTAFVAWLQNDANEVFSTSGHPSRLYASRYAGGAWSEPVLVATLAGTSGTFDVATDGNRAVLVWPLDEDGDFSTADDCKLHAAVWDGGAWGTEVAITDGGNGDFLPKAFFGTNGVYSVVWNHGGEWVVGEEGAMETATAIPFGDDICPPGSISLKSAGIGKTALLWGDVSEVRCMVFDQESGMWTLPVPVAKSGANIRSFGADFDTDGNIRLATEEAEATYNEEGRCEYGKSEIVRSVFAEGANPAVFAKDFFFATNEVMAGELTPIVTTVHNLGLEAASNVTLRLWMCDGELEEDEDSRCELFGESGEACVLDLPGGAVIAVTNLWMAEDFRTNLTFVARLELPEGTTDTDLSDDEAVWRPGVASLHLEEARCESVGASLRLLTATVRNKGFAAAEAGTAVSFRLDSPGGTEVGRDVAGVVRAGEGHGYDAGVAWDMAENNWTDAWVTVYAVIDTGDEESDLSGALPIRVMTPLDTDGEGLLDGEEEAMGTDLQNPDTNGDGISDYDHVYVWFTDPLAGMGGSSTTNTPVRVPFVWLEQYEEALAAHDGDYEAFAAATAANGRPVWACYVADLNPTKADSELRVGLVQDENGAWVPRIVSGESAERRYVFEGTEKLPEKAGDSDWGEPDEKTRFFRARVTAE